MFDEKKPEENLTSLFLNISTSKAHKNCRGSMNITKYQAPHVQNLGF